MKNHKTFRLLILCAAFVLFNLAALQGQSVTQETSDISVDENTLKSYVGRYDYGQGMVLIVTLEDDQLYAQLTGQEIFPIFPSSKNQFFWKVVDANVTFVADEKGNVTHAIHRQNGGELDAKKLPDETPVAVDPAIFVKYIGKYNAADYGIVVVSKEENKLFVQGANLPVYQLLPASETEYFLREIQASIKFSINEQGIANSAVINLAGNVFSVVRIQD